MQLEDCERAHPQRSAAREKLERLVSFVRRDAGRNRHGSLVAEDFERSPIDQDAQPDNAVNSGQRHLVLAASKLMSARVVREWHAAHHKTAFLRIAQFDFRLNVE